MRRLSFIIILILTFSTIHAQSPHGSGFKLDCALCHTSESWNVSKSNLKFDHATTSFPLSGQHKNVECRQCHASLVFSGLSSNCISCHKDIHKNSVGSDCARCHTPQTWLVLDINEVHQKSRFPLLGVHINQDCAQCHSRFPELDFEVQGINCYECHEKDFRAATNPDHVKSNFSKECQECHAINSSSWISVNINHDFFPLTGGHNISNCFQCHTSGKFTGLSQDCYSCHKNTYNATLDPNHTDAGFAFSCTNCHTIAGWKPASFDHSSTGFTLSGAHLNKSCNACHSTGYKTTSADCYSCHKQNYETAADPNHLAAKFPTECSQCHTTNSWEPTNFDHSTTNFPLTGKHVSVSCASCHSAGFSGTPTDCYSCHQQNYDNTSNPNHKAAMFSTTCSDCHNTDGWTPATFDHDGKYFPIYSGSHRGQWNTCADCHTNSSNFSEFSCITCHEHNKTDMDDEHKEVSGYQYVSAACYSCHPAGSSQGAFNHSTSSFPLLGSHATVSCEDCHKTSYANTPTDCNSCHNQNFLNTISPNHILTGISTDCSQCHTPSGWTPSNFNHANTAFVLTGVHITTQCESCHKGQIAGTNSECYSCHKTDYDKTLNPNHSASGYPTVCETCHTTSAWSPANINHDLTKFPLTGKHVSVTCEQCHTSGYTNTPMDCNSCHSADFNATLNPNHKTVGISNTCESCHNTSGWSPSSFNHSASAFVLTGSHLTAKCESCHQGQTSGTTQQCYGCHKSNFEATTNPNHVTSGFPTDCQQCHTTSAWSPATFDHATTNFPLTGKHTSVLCTQCHASGYSNTPTDCNSCHSADFSSTLNPNHKAVGISSVCESCHNTSSWSPSSFNHSATAFVLTGSHLTAKCESCHQGQTTGTPQSCYSCHSSNFTATLTPSHVQTGISTQCAECHSTSAWKPSSFNHSNTAFILTGVHLTTSCESCHQGKTTGTTQQCYGCHKSNFDATTNPNHVTSGFPTDCQQCHTTSAWTPATFDHSTTNFPLTGKHTSVLCTQCHTSGYTNTPKDCYSCHSANYNSTTNPSHIASNFPTACEQCHTTSGWTPATFDHDGMYFPIYSGPHRGEWKSCSDCHTVPSNYSSFSCINCHEHSNKSEVDSDHRGVANYVYQSQACYNCHPTGRSK